MRFALAILAAMAATAVFLFSPQPIKSQDAAQPNEQFRVSVGWQDTEPKPWNGRVTVTGAALAQLAGWRFSQTDSASNDGGFDFKTKRGPLENQLRQGAPFGQTAWDSPDIQRLIPQGLIVHTTGPAAVIAIDAPSGSFSFRPSQIPFGGSLSLLSGNARVERLPVENKLSEAGKSDDYPALAVTPDGARWIAWLSYENAADRILVSHGGNFQRCFIQTRNNHDAGADFAVDLHRNLYLDLARQFGIIGWPRLLEHRTIEALLRP